MDAPLDEVVRLTEKHDIKRVPVLRGSELVGMVSRSDILHAFVVLSPKPNSASVSDAEIRRQIETELDKQAWAQQSAIDVQVNDGIVDLSGAMLDQRQRTALRVAAENVSGVKQVRDRLVLSQAVRPQRAGSGAGLQDGLSAGSAGHCTGSSSVTDQDRAR